MKDIDLSEFDSYTLISYKKFDTIQIFYQVVCIWFAAAFHLLLSSSFYWLRISYMTIHHVWNYGTKKYQGTWYLCI